MVLSFCWLVNYCFRTAGGVVFNKKATKIDQEGCQDLLTGERNQHILKTDIEVRTSSLTPSVRRNPRRGQRRAREGRRVKSIGHPRRHQGKPIQCVILQIINLFDKEKRHQFYNEYDMIANAFPLFVSPCLPTCRSTITASSTTKARFTSLWSTWTAEAWRP